MVFFLTFGLRQLQALARPIVHPIFVASLYLTAYFLDTILSAWVNSDRTKDMKFEIPDQATFDFVIAGAGSAGSLLANRLSRSHTVLLLEAGGEPHPFQFFPLAALFMFNMPQLDWSYKTVPQKRSTLMSVNQQGSWSAGRGLGGSGNLNLMIHLRGHQRDYDNWAKVLNDSQWSWEGVREYFKRYEDYEIPGDHVNHGYNGELRIEAPDFVGRGWDYVKAANELGYPHVDLNAPFDEGFDIHRYPIRKGRRQAPYLAFLKPIRSRPSLTILKFAHVNRVLFRNGNIAYGVEYDRHGRTFTARAKYEVILSAGTVSTPQILMLSGVGDKSHLSDHNIPVIHDLPDVGLNLQDHTSAYLAPIFVKPGLGTYADRDITLTEFMKFITFGTGRITSTSCEAVGLVASEIAKSKGEGNWPDLTLFLVSFSNFAIGAETFARAFNLKFDELNQYIRNDIARDSYMIIVQGSRPKSRGYVKLGGPSPYDIPIIDPNYFGDPEQNDIKVVLDGVKKSLILMENTTAMGYNVGARFTTARLPGCRHLPFRSDEYWLCFIRRYTVTLHHYVGTAALGKVVNTDLTVKGVRNLRVVDGSVSPVIITTNTQASILMIAEKAADMILSYWNTRQY